MCTFQKLRKQRKWLVDHSKNMETTNPGRRKYEIEENTHRLKCAMKTNGCAADLESNLSKLEKSVRILKRCQQDQGQQKHWETGKSLTRHAERIYPVLSHL